jgi:hypothetical protein
MTNRKQHLLDNALLLRDVKGTGAAARYLARFGVPFEDARYLLARAR